jgi:hypothetical protein
MSYSSEFQINYASLVLDLEKLNKDLSEYLNGVKHFSDEYNTTTASMIGNEAMSKKQHSSSNNNNKNKTDSSSGNVSSSDETSSTSQHSSSLSFSRLQYQLDSYSKSDCCLKEAIDLVTKLNKSEEDDTPSSSSSTTTTKKIINSKASIDLIVKLTSMLLQMKNLVNEAANDISSAGRNEENDEIENNNGNELRLLPFSTKQLNECIMEIKNSLLSAANAQLFEDKVQVHMNHIESVLCHYSKLHAFNYGLDHHE